MKLTPQDLQDKSRYQLLEELEHAEIVKFVQKYIYRNNPIAWFFWLSNIAVVAILAYQFGADIQQKNFVWNEALASFSVGILACFLGVIVLHENIHCLAYLSVGAKNATVKYQWRKMIFLAVADKFVANGKEFFWVAILPFLVITSATVAGIFFMSQAWFYFLMGILFMHTGACGGDFALISFLYEHRGRQVLTYDDMSEGKSYFYAGI